MSNDIKACQASTLLLVDSGWGLGASLTGLPSILFKAPHLGLSAAENRHFAKWPNLF
jgi:hypothetical protein